MHRHIGSLVAILLLVVCTSAFAQAKRKLLPPPEGYYGIDVNGQRYFVGQLHLAHFSDTTDLKQYGFRDFEAVGSDAWHKKVKAIWPVVTDLEVLPDNLKGLSYEKVHNAAQAAQAYNADKAINPLSLEYGYGTVIFTRGYRGNSYSSGSSSYRRSSYNESTTYHYGNTGKTYSTPAPTKLKISPLAARNGYKGRNSNSGGIGRYR